MSGRCDCGRPISGNKTQCLECSSKPSGVLEILNCQAGDIKISFSKDSPVEVIRAKRIITDMLRRGFALIVEVERDGEKKYERVQEFDEAHGDYIIADFDPTPPPQMPPRMVALKEVYEKDYAADPENVSAAAPQPSAEPDVEAPAQTPGKKDGRGKYRRRLPMETTKATAVGRSAGG